MHRHHCVYTEYFAMNAQKKQVYSTKKLSIRGIFLRNRQKDSYYPGKNFISFPQCIFMRDCLINIRPLSCYFFGLYELFRETIRLNTRWSSLLSLESQQKYPFLTN